MSILSVDTIQPIGSGSTVTLNAAKIVVGTGITFESNGQAIYAGIITATSFSGSGANLTSIPAGQLTGTVADARISTLTSSKLSGALPAISGANLTNLPAANLTGTLPAISGANLTSLPAQATIANNADNRVITGGSGVNLNGESGLTFDGTTLTVSGASNSTQAIFAGTGGSGSRGLEIKTESGGAVDEVVVIKTRASGTTGAIKFQTNGANSLELTGNGGDVIVKQGNLKFGIGGKGIDFSSTGDVSGMTSELLDDYEEGSFTPTYSNTGGVTPAYNYREGLYTKIGNLVTCAGIIGCTNANSFGSSMQIRIDLPFTCAANTYGMAGGSISDGAGWQNVASGAYLVGPLISGGQSYGRLVTLGGSPSNVYYTGTPGLQNSHYFRFRFTYPAA